MGPIEAFKLFFTKFADFSGRTRRKEFWWINLYILLSYLPIGLIDLVGIPASALWSLAIVVPAVALLVRRLHDVSMSGLYALLVFIPVLGLILYIVWGATETKPANQWGPPARPLYPHLFRGSQPPPPPVNY